MLARGLPAAIVSTTFVCIARIDRIPYKHCKQRNSKWEIEPSQRPPFTCKTAKERTASTSNRYAATDTQPAMVAFVNVPTMEMAPAADIKLVAWLRLRRDGPYADLARDTSVLTVTP